MALDDTMVEAVLAHHRGYASNAKLQDAAWADAVARILQNPELDAADHWDLYSKIFAERAAVDGPPLAWTPSQRRVERANVTAFGLEQKCADYAALHAWSVQNRGAYWDAVARRLGIRFGKAPTSALEEPCDAEQPNWFARGFLNIADSCFQADPAQVAIVNAQEGTDELERMTFGELNALANRFANGLQANHILPGDGVALYMPMTPLCVAAYLGIIKAGCHVVSIPDSFAPAEVATRLRLGSARIVVTMDHFQRGGKQVPMHSKVLEATAILKREADEKGAPAPDIRCVVIEPGHGPLDWSWNEFLADDDHFHAVLGPPDRTCNILFSSGTTGDPKAIPWTHLTPIKAAADGHFHQDIHPGDVVAWPTNIGWMMGPWLIFATFINRATMFLYQGVPTSPHFVEQVARANVAVLGVVPAIVRGWKSAGIPPHSLPDVQTFTSTGEASNVRDTVYLMGLAGYRAPVVEYCGGTEIGGGHLTGSVVQPASPATFSTPALGIDFDIRDDAGESVSPGGMGEIFLRPPSVGLSQRLLNKDHHEEYYAGVAPGPRGETMRRHGDEVKVLHGGYWAAQGRADDTMNLGGIKVGSIELEEVLNGHPAVKETAAVAVQAGGEGADQLVVFAVADAAPELQRELQQRIKERLNPLFRIHDVVLVEALPRTASNKVMRRALRAQYLAT